jgi:hypothetical protein
MQLIRYVSHAMWEPCHVWHDGSVRPTVRSPAVVEDDVIVSQVAKAPVHNLPCSAEQQRLAHITGIGVPIVLISNW